MDKVDRLGQLMGALRQRVQEAQRGQRSSAPSAAAGAQQSQGAEGLEGLRDRIRERIQALAPDDPGREARASRIFVESVLVWEFGEALLDDPQLGRLVEQVDERMADDEGLRSQLRGVIDDLTR